MKGPAECLQHMGIAACRSRLQETFSAMLRPLIAEAIVTQGLSYAMELVTPAHVARLLLPGQR